MKKKSIKGVGLFKNSATALFITAFVSMFDASAANVSVKNGDFFIGFTDFYFSGGLDLSVSRTFNSKSSYNGNFGFGWSSEQETYLVSSADGSFVIHENGGGALNRFVPGSGVKETEVNQAVETIAAAHAKEGTNKDSLDKYRERLRTDARFRNDEWERFWEKGLVQAKSVADGTQFRSNKFSFQILTKTKAGFVRNFDNGRVETFNDHGRLIRVADKNQNFLNITYGKDGHIQSVDDNYNRHLNFKYNQMGKVSQISAEGGKTASYDYDGNLLIRSRDVDGNTFGYRYSADGRYNLTEIKYKDNTTLQLGYYPPAKGEGVAWQKDRDGTRTEYEYSDGGPTALNYWTAVTIRSGDGKVLSKSRYEYTEKVKADGERYTYRLVTELDGEKTDTVYNECCGLPLKITRNGDETSFEYDAKGHVTKKITNSEVTELSYDAKISKVTKVMKYSKTEKSKDSQQWASYQYDDKGNLVFAKSSTGKGVRIVYDTNGRIKALVDQDKRRLEFVYNEHSKPIQIVDPSVGKIDVTYGNSGEIKKVSSTGGRAIAMQVTSAFQNLLDIIRPAGVTLSF